ncbi:hypothetical protein R3P38DRAFT_3628967 [Favolaschia claudopus]|uniref:Uncharacterized protein n=1 Tax=Favolaschia claudopus TaxID=2862362 RepID=A0AAV9ZEE5_9AGAR
MPLLPEGLRYKGTRKKRSKAQQESRRATVIDQDNNKKTFFLGIGMGFNHTSEQQLEGRTELIEAAYQG